MRYLDTGGRDSSQTLAKWLEEVTENEVAEIRFQTGFFSIDGVGLLLPSLKLCKQQDRTTKILIGSNDASTLKKDVIYLFDILGIPRESAQLGIVSFEGAFFHPKTYHIKRPDGSQAAFVGSANLTAPGLALHVEAGIALDTREGDAPHHLSQIAAAIDAWFEEQREGMTLVASLQTVDDLINAGVLALAPPPRSSTPNKKETEDQKISRPRLKRLFSLPKIKIALTPDAGSYVTINELPDNDTSAETLPPTPAQSGKNKIFLMTLQKTDVGVGQTTEGASRRSPEIFIPLSARDANTDFWGWPDLFQADSKNEGKMDRFGVKMRIGTTIVNVNMMTWPAKHDFRLRSEQLRSAGNIGDILYMERSNSQSEYFYYVEVIPLNSARHGQYLAQCVNSVRNSTRKWGYI